MYTGQMSVLHVWMLSSKKRKIDLYVSSVGIQTAKTVFTRREYSRKVRLWKMGKRKEAVYVKFATASF